MDNRLNLRNIPEKRIYDLGDDFCGENGKGDRISFSNFYMKKNDKAYFGVSGEFHYSRMSEARWEDEIIKMRMAEIHIVTTYVFWIHHEEEEGIFDFTGCRNLRRFVQLCQKHGMYVILRVGPFNHGEARNGGLPDWLYGKPFEVRKLNEGFLKYTTRLYKKIADQVEDLFFKDDGPIIGVQIDNEYMHASAPWEITSGTSNEWVFCGDDGEEYMLTLKALAAECGLLPVFYTCTGWGGAIAPDSMIPLWGGYAFRPWLFYDHKGEHPATEEYVYQNFHKNGYNCNYDFHPAYNPEEKPYSCCEMGGGMNSSYNYRFQYPYKSVDAMANIKIASGCNFLGYYMFQGGSNPIGKKGLYLNEGQMPKISYDFQAALGEYGQIRESYQRTKSIHQFVTAFGEDLCLLQTVLPEGASWIDANDGDTLRYAVRTDGKKGYLFINNYQDHALMSEKSNENITIELDSESIDFEISLAVDENAILPFHFDMSGIDLVNATAQVVTKLVNGEHETYVFLCPDKMEPNFFFEKEAHISGINGESESNIYHAKLVNGIDFFTVRKGSIQAEVLVISRELSNQMYCYDSSLIFTRAALLYDENGLKIETTSPKNEVYFFPAKKAADGILTKRIFEVSDKKISVECNLIAPNRYIVTIPENCFEGVKDARLQIEYCGDIGQAFINGKLINDNFCNHAIWEIGLSDFKDDIRNHDITVHITPSKENDDVTVGKIDAAIICPVYEIQI